MIQQSPTCRQIGNYTVTSDGRVFSESRNTGHFGGRWRRNIKRIERQITHRCGIAEICIWLDGKRTRFRLDRLVASLFLGDRGPEWTVKHINGDPFDCRLENLEWVEV